jgi:dihydroorotate dehydrogenase (fumarate)
MIDLSTEYLGLKLRSPLVASAGPLTRDIDNVRRMEDSGLAAVVMHSLFEEQIEIESQELDGALWGGAESFPEATSYFPDLATYNIGPDYYVEQVEKARRGSSIPVIGSLNGISPGGWLRYGRLIEQAGADALELNIYHLTTDPKIPGAAVEQQYIDLVLAVKESLGIPVAVKLGPFFTSIPHLAHRLDEAGADGLVLFNRFYQPDFDIESLEVVPQVKLSDSSELLMRLHWAAILYGQVEADLAITGGVHSGADALKAVAAGASAVMTTSCLLRRGISYAREIEREMVHWLEEHEYESAAQMRGSMSYQSVTDVSAFERGNYMRVLSSYSMRKRHLGMD